MGTGMTILKAMYAFLSHRGRGGEQEAVKICKQQELIYEPVELPSK